MSSAKAEVDGAKIRFCGPEVSVSAAGVPAPFIEATKEIGSEDGAEDPRILAASRDGWLAPWIGAPGGIAGASRGRSLGCAGCG
jgi:hypothetical protein